MILHACPYCGAPVTIEETEGNNGRRGCVVACNTCGMAGPESYSGNPDVAARAWEILCSRMCSHCRKGLIKHFTTRIRELKAEIALLKREAPPGE